MRNTIPAKVHAPESLAAALKLLAAEGVGVVFGQAPPVESGAAAAGALMTTSALPELAGIHQFGGYIVAGCNASQAELARSSLVRGGATCLAEACDPPSESLATLGGSLWPWAAPSASAPPAFSFMHLALAALAAEVELAWLDGRGELQRAWSGLTWAEERQERRTLPLAVRVRACGQRCGSALVRAPAAAGAALSARAAAGCLRLHPQRGTVEEAALAVLPAAGAPLLLPVAAQSLAGKEITAQALAEAARQAHAESMPALPATAAASGYPLHPIAHLVRQALDRCAARALQDARGGGHYTSHSPT